MERRPQARWFGAAALATVILVLFGWNRAQAAPGYTPGLGEIMTLTQMRHAKLWLAGQAGNWPLASYELDELEEGFHDAIEYHPTHKDSPVPIADMIPSLTDAPIEALRSAVEKQDRKAFTLAFDTLTEACNACHQATNFGFNVVVRPSGNSFLNQDFSAPARDTKGNH